MDLEFKSKLELTEGLCFRIKEHDGYRDYPTRFKILAVSDTPAFKGQLVEILSIDTDVEKF
jgi:hypothetical protein